MKSKELTELIRNIVRQEIKKALPDLLSSVFKKLMETPNSENVISENKRPSGDTITNKRSVLDENNLLGSGGLLKDAFITNNKQNDVKIEKKRYTNISILNDILNETTPFTKSESTPIQFDSPLLMETIGDNSHVETISSQTPSALDFKDSPELPPSINKILNKDYRSLIIAMDKIKKK
jgi:hypothetical protein